MKDNNTYFGHEEEKNLPNFLRKNPFSVPEQYFNTLTSQIKSSVQLHQIQDKASLPFSLPERYFDESQTILSWEIKKDILFRKTGFTTPQDYFESSKQVLLQEVKLSSFKESQETVFDTPPNYFTQLQASILQKIEEDKGAEFVESDGFAVPDAYFENSKQAIIAHIASEYTTTSPSVVVSQKPATSVRKLNDYRLWIKYAAAACLLAVLGIGSYSYLSGPELQNATAQNEELSTISDEEIANYLAQYGDAEDHIFFSNYELSAEDIHADHTHDETGVCKNVKAEDIEDYLNYML